MSESKVPWKVGQRRRVGLVNVSPNAMALGRVEKYDSVVYQWLLVASDGCSWGVMEDWPNELVSEAPEEKPEPKIGDVWRIATGQEYILRSWFKSPDGSESWEVVKADTGEALKTWVPAVEFSDGRMTFVRRGTPNRPEPRVGDVWGHTIHGEFELCEMEGASWRARRAGRTRALWNIGVEEFAKNDWTLVHRASEAPKEPSHNWGRVSEPCPKCKGPCEFPEVEYAGSAPKPVTEPGKVTITVRQPAPKSAGEVEGTNTSYIDGKNINERTEKNDINGVRVAEQDSSNGNRMLRVDSGAQSSGIWKDSTGRQERNGAQGSVGVPQRPSSPGVSGQAQVPQPAMLQRGSHAVGYTEGQYAGCSAGRENLEGSAALRREAERSEGIGNTSATIEGCALKSTGARVWGELESDTKNRAQPSLEGMKKAKNQAPVCIDCGTKEKLAERWIRFGYSEPVKRQQCDACYLIREAQIANQTEGLRYPPPSAAPVEPYRPLWRDLGGYGIFNRRGR